MSDRIEAAIRELADALREAATTAQAPPDGREELLGVEEAARRLSIGRTLAYQLIARGELRSHRIGRRRLVPSGALAEYIERAAGPVG